MSDTWKPIETAPRAALDARSGAQGPHFLAYEGGKMAVGYLTRWSDREPWQFYIAHVGGYEFEQDVNQPTHWTELPPAPR